MNDVQARVGTHKENIREKHVLVHPGLLDSVTRRSEADLDNAGKTDNHKRKMLHKWQRTSETRSSNLPTPSGRLGGNKFKRPWQTSSKMVATPICQSGCEMHKRLKQLRGPIEAKAALHLRLMKL
jgi:hypothetical protein